MTNNCLWCGDEVGAICAPNECGGQIDMKRLMRMQMQARLEKQAARLEQEVFGTTVMNRYPIMAAREVEFEGVRLWTAWDDQRCATLIRVKCEADLTVAGRYAAELAKQGLAPCNVIIEAGNGA